jgi:hypothetical protein
LTSSHETKTTSFRRYGIAEAYTARDFLLKTGLKSEFGSVEPEQGVTKSNRAYAVSSDTKKETNAHVPRQRPSKKPPPTSFPPPPRTCFFFNCIFRRFSASGDQKASVQFFQKLFEKKSMSKMFNKKMRNFVFSLERESR